MTDDGEWQTMRDDRKCWMTDNERWQTMVDNKQWEMTDSDRWQTLRDERQWWMTDNERWQTMVNDRQWDMTDNGEWHTWSRFTVLMITTACRTPLYRNNGKMLHNVGCHENNQKYIQDNIIICGW